MNLLNQVLTTAQAETAGSAIKLNGAPRNLVAQANFLFGSGTAIVNVYLQTSIDGGLTWIDIAQWSFAGASARSVVSLNGQTPVTTQVTALDGALAANTVLDGILGSMFRVKTISTGTYAGNTRLTVDIETDQAA